MTVNELIKRLERLEKVYGRDAPVLLEVAGLPEELEAVYVDAGLDLIILGKEEVK